MAHNLKALVRAACLGLILAGAGISCSGGGGGEDAGASPAGLEGETAAIDGKSMAQNAFTAVRGRPDAFTVGFITEELNTSGHPAPSGVRRIETWTYNKTSLKTDQFDNGYFVQERDFGAPDPAGRATPLRPDQFVPGMGQAQIVALLGSPSCEQTWDMGGKNYVAMRYNPSSTLPATSVVLEDDRAVQITSGFAFATSGATSTSLCLQ